MHITRLQLRKSHLTWWFWWSAASPTGSKQCAQSVTCSPSESTSQSFASRATLRAKRRVHPCWLRHLLMLLAWRFAFCARLLSAASAPSDSKCQPCHPQQFTPASSSSAATSPFELQTSPEYQGKALRLKPWSRTFPECG